MRHKEVNLFVRIKSPTVSDGFQTDMNYLVSWDETLNLHLNIVAK